jgi:hypothetical protein
MTATNALLLLQNGIVFVACDFCERDRVFFFWLVTNFQSREVAMAKRAVVVM